MSNRIICALTKTLLVVGAPIGFVGLVTWLTFITVCVNEAVLTSLETALAGAGYDMLTAEEFAKRLKIDVDNASGLG